MKFNFETKPMAGPRLSQIFLVMKFAALFIMVTLTNVWAKSYSQITINERKASVEKILELIETQSNFHFLYDKLDLVATSQVKLSVKNVSVEEALKACLKNQPLTYKIFQETIVIAHKQDKTQQAVVDFKVQGIVTDETGEPLPGVSVRVKGTTLGTATDASGRFILNAPDGTSTVIFSFIGYTTREVAINNQETINVQLKPVPAALNEVVVVGYGTQKKKDITGAVSSVGADAYEDQPVVSPASALQGRAAGVAVSSNSGAPGGSVKVRIRGSNSINSSNDSLIVVDGVALSSVGLQDINVNDIASTDILKDASATAIYGSRGANGVIMITTKSGQSGMMNVNYNTFATFNSLPKQYDLINASAYAGLVNYIDGKATFANPQSLGSGTDWQEQLYRTGVSQNHQLSISGGSDKSKYYLSGYYVDQDGIITNTGQTKYSVRSNLNTKVFDKITVGLNLFATHAKSRNTSDLGYKGNPVSGALSWAPTESVYDSPGKYNRNGISPLFENPLMIARERLGDSYSNSGIINATAKYDITDWLSLSATAGLDLNMTRNAFLNNEIINTTTQSSGQTSI